MLVDAVGRQQKNVALFDRKRPVVDFDLRIDPQRAAEIALLRGNDDPMIVGELLERVAGERGRFGSRRREKCAPSSI